MDKLGAAAPSLCDQVAMCHVVLVGHHRTRCERSILIVTDARDATKANSRFTSMHCTTPPLTAEKKSKGIYPNYHT